MAESFVFSSESVGEGHPDKVADFISDSVLDACLEQDPKSRVACETLVKSNHVVLAGEITTSAKLNYEMIVRDAIREIGYTHNDDVFHADCVFITNLLTNAITYNKENGEVRVEAEAKDGTVILRVSDTGVGISAEDLPRVFDRFYRVDNSRTSGNTGLGLAISKAIVEAHGGQIDVASEPEKGTVFTMRLPLS